LSRSRPMAASEIREMTMAIVTPRVQVPASVTRNELFLVKTLISHRMETGLRQDAQGKVIPRQIINRFLCRFNGVDVFKVDLHEAVAANPFFEFSLRATESGTLDFVWEEDGGAIYTLSHQLTVN
jgi:sulfur-oxidizing protein SoxZ